MIKDCGKILDNTMVSIKRFLEFDSELYDVLEYDGHLEAKTDTVMFMIVSPHSGTDFKWMLRVTTVANFDRWANSTAVEEFFDSDIKLTNYLSNHQLDIYKELVEYLSNKE